MTCNMASSFARHETFGISTVETRMNSIYTAPVSKVDAIQYHFMPARQNITRHLAIFEVFTAVTMKNAVF
jgi:hypothetical protein